MTTANDIDTKLVQPLEHLNLEKQKVDEKSSSGNSLCSSINSPMLSPRDNDDNQEEYENLNTINLPDNARINWAAENDNDTIQYLPLDYDSGIRQEYSQQESKSEVSSHSDHPDHSKQILLSADDKENVPIATITSNTNEIILPKKLPPTTLPKSKLTKSQKRKNAKKNKKQQNRDRKASKVFSQNTTIPGDECAVFQILIGVPRQHISKIIGGKGKHLKSYQMKNDVSVTIIPGYKFDKKISGKQLRKDRITGEITDHVIRLEAYNKEDLKCVIERMQKQFEYPINYIVIELDDASDWDDDDYYNQFLHHGDYYAGQFNYSPAKQGKYNNKHTDYDKIKDVPTWPNEKYQNNMTGNVSDVLSFRDEYSDAMDRDSYNYKMAHLVNESYYSGDNYNYPDPNDQKGGGQKGGGKKGKAGRKSKYNPKIEKKCSCLSLNKRTETNIEVTWSYKNTIMVRQPTHPSYQSLDLLEENLWHFYNTYGSYYNNDLFETIAKTTESGTYVVIQSRIYQNRYHRARVEEINKKHDLVKLFLMDWGYFQIYPRSQVFTLFRSATMDLRNSFSPSSVPFQATPLELVPLRLSNEQIDKQIMEIANNTCTDTEKDSMSDALNSSGEKRKNKKKNKNLEGATIEQARNSILVSTPRKHHEFLVDTINEDYIIEAKTIDDINHYAMPQAQTNGLFAEIVKEVSTSTMTNDGLARQYTRIYTKLLATGEKVYIDFDGNEFYNDPDVDYFDQLQKEDLEKNDQEDGEQEVENVDVETVEDNVENEKIAEESQYPELEIIEQTLPTEEIAPTQIDYTNLDPNQQLIQLGLNYMTQIVNQITQLAIQQGHQLDADYVNQIFYFNGTPFDFNGIKQIGEALSISAQTVNFGSLNVGANEFIPSS